MRPRGTRRAALFAVRRVAAWPRVVAGMLVGLWLALAPGGVAAASPSPAIEGGVFTPREVDGRGFSVTDDRGLALFSAYTTLGGEAALGGAVSRRFLYRGLVAQLFERGMIAWIPASARGVLVNTFDDLSAAGHDARLGADYGLVGSADWSQDAGLSWAALQARHLALLEGPEPWRQALRAAYRNAPGAEGSWGRAVALHGLPMGIGPTPNGYALRAQRAAWVVDAEAEPRPRSVDVRALLASLGVVPADALVPHWADERPHVRPSAPVFAVHFFDWWRSPNLPTAYFTHQITWERIGITLEQVGSPAYYDANFRLIQALGADGVVWEWYEGGNMTPSATVLDALRAHGLKIGLFYDWELLHAGGKAVLSEAAYIAPDDASLQRIGGDVIAFYRGIPRDLWLLDADGRLPVLVYAYGFPAELTEPEPWAWFFGELARRVETALAVDAVFDWSFAYLPPSHVQDYAFERFPDSYQPFNFVVDIPQPQYGHHVVTWNFIFDNRGVAKRDQLPRVVRDDNRYLQETLWLATHTAPSLVFMYSWNELWEGSHLLPDDTYGWRRYDLARAMIATVRERRADDLPRTLILVDAMDAFPTDGAALFTHERTLLRHYLRRYTPQAIARRVDAVAAEDLAGFDLILSITTDRRADPLLAQLPERVRVVYWNATDPGTSMATRFVGGIAGDPPLGRFRVLGADGAGVDEPLIAEGDVLDVAPADGSEILLRFDRNGRLRPLVVRRGNDIWVNAYRPHDGVLSTVFAAVYGRALEPGITFALGAQIQRLEVFPDGRIVHNTFQAPAVFRHDPLPVHDFAPAPPAGL
ncbi:MAG: hypothetical protein FJ029_04290 [Actinobacteria bacterium]|nr:hypothetical protein [Actinomycetota bacterium]